MGLLVTMIHPTATPHSSPTLSGFFMSAASVHGDDEPLQSSLFRPSSPSTCVSCVIAWTCPPMFQQRRQPTVPGGHRHAGERALSLQLGHRGRYLADAQFPLPEPPGCCAHPALPAAGRREWVERLDSWDSCGMAATGSHDVRTHQLLVPHERVFALHEVSAHAYLQKTFPSGHISYL